MGWREYVVCKPLIGDQKYIDRFYDQYKEELNSNNMLVLEGWKDVDVNGLLNQCPGVTFIGYHICDNTCGQYDFSQILFNKKNGCFFKSPERFIDSENRVVFDEKDPALIRGTVDEDGDKTYSEEEAYTTQINVNKADSEDIFNLQNASIELYRRQIGITDDEYTQLHAKKFSHFYTTNCEIYTDNKFKLIIDLKEKLKDVKHYFQREMICKKLVSDLDLYAIKNNASDTDEYREQERLFAESAAETHIKFPTQYWAAMTLEPNERSELYR